MWFVDVPKYRESGLVLIALISKISYGRITTGLLFRNVRSLLEAISKIGFWFKVAAGLLFKPEEYFEYFEDLKRGTNKDIGPKDIFEIASNK
jgi:hypothetical protein